ncbi:hypothetical protein AB685_17960 [Bacillus sp. LL01]|uniref:hypothetical protein n=1 Tax=Bacillus sp. LL01 TaxID=1665556 RepID=UPI00064D6C0D|nr:hypothetical protein [Bacillus sp. LL01]KMJ57283.1 hypothetical protein AB685_17960 [Bacillus sp. LL01]
MDNMLYRKFTAFYVSTFIISILISASSFGQGEPIYLDSFLGWTYILLFVVGGIILIYGNLISIGIEYVVNRWMKGNSIIFILLHGLLGGLPVIWSQHWMLTLYASGAALLYALVDRWIYYRSSRDKHTWQVHTIAPILFLILFAIFMVKSQPLPPYSAEEAVAIAISGEVIDS